MAELRAVASARVLRNAPERHLGLDPEALVPVEGDARSSSRAPRALVWREHRLVLSERAVDSPWSGGVAGVAPPGPSTVCWRHVLVVLLMACVGWTWWRPPPGPLPCDGTLVCGRPLDLNYSTAEELLLIPGVGPATSDRIVSGRPFQSVEDLLRVKGIGPVTLARLRPYLAVLREPPPPPEPVLLDPNTATVDELEGLPRVGPVLARRIVEGRPYRSVRELDRVKGIGPATLAGLEPCLLVRPEVTP